MTTERLGKWHLIGRVAEGSTSAVWVAARSPNERCALKVLHDHVAVRDDLVRRFVDEARVLARVQSRHLPALIELGQHDGKLFMAMELVDGPSLSAARRVRPGPVPQAAAVAIARDVARALVALHDAGARPADASALSHGDVAPPNILLEREAEHDRSRAVLVDLGLAHDSSRGASAATPTPGLEGGRLAYTSPEQVAGRAGTPAADIYALGVVLYELLCGRRPFVAADSLALRRAITAAPLDDPRALVSGLDLGLAETMSALLARDPLHRPTAREAVLALDGCLARGGVDGAAALAAYVKSLALPSLRLA